MAAHSSLRYPELDVGGEGPYVIEVAEGLVSQVRLRAGDHREGACGDEALTDLLAHRSLSPGDTRFQKYLPFLPVD